MMITKEDNNKLLYKNKEQTLKRNYGIDLLKIISMINVIILHINNRDFYNLQKIPKHPKFKQVCLLEILSFWPVNTFGLISGIIGFKKYKFSNIIYIWFEYFYYSVFFSIYLFINSLLDLKGLISSMFPLGIKNSWYINAYFFLYILLPFLTNSINIIDRYIFTKLICLYFFFYSLYNKLIEYNFGKTNFDFANNGYSSIWLIILFIIGGYIGRFYNKYLFSKLFLFIIFIFSSFITSEHIFYNLDKKNVANTILIDYNSPTIIIQALSLTLLFSKVNINNKYIKMAISFFIPLNMCVLIIHMTIFSFKTSNILKFKKYIEQLNPKYLIFKKYAISILIYFLCAFFDYFRSIIFKITKIRYLSKYIEKKYFKEI